MLGDSPLFCCSLISTCVTALPAMAPLLVTPGAELEVGDKVDFPPDLWSFVTWVLKRHHGCPEAGGFYQHSLQLLSLNSFSVESQNQTLWLGFRTESMLLKLSPSSHLHGSLHPQPPFSPKHNDLMHIISLISSCKQTFRGSKPKVSISQQYSC